MRRRSLRRGATAIAIAALAVAALAVAVPAGGSSDQGTAVAAGKKRVAKVKVGDDFFAPSKLKVRKGTKVKWKWLPTNGDLHNVTLVKAPRGVKKNKFKSATGSIGIKFNRKLKKAGKYKFVCTIHRTVMKQTIRVKKR